ncbi:hypothetical protein LB572_08395 [Mesorhizobium sp. BH1-1-5]|uniref:hypothetical protein n=1 Tax=Mesorhizobium sp. BH1-1-5 TaxID=2876661 RepID=UPI001CCE5546|nr:hypothetical protein [Mesorhizobium sp. BH1-1-5]MBZ9987115.1 hypothetical protein [Mesorhizobium sp. BH1-1-5]
MMLRLLASVGSPLTIRPGASATQRILSKQVLKGAIRLSFAAYRLSLPISPSNTENHDRKIA